MKKLASIVLAVTLTLSSITTTYALTDELILKDATQNTYTGIKETPSLIKNLTFSDVPADFWANEAIVRSGALNLVKGYTETYKPNSNVTNQEALAFVLRAMGMEDVSQQTGVTLQAQAPANSPLRTLWSLGYLNQAQQLGLITLPQYNDALVADQTTLDPATNFLRDAAVTKEQFTDWLVSGIQILKADAFPAKTSQQSVYPFSDWELLTPSMVDSMETAVSNGIISGQGDGKLNPKGPMTKAATAQMLKNMDKIYYNVMGIEKKTGTVGAIQDAQATTTGGSALARQVMVRTADGKKDVIQYDIVSTTSPQDTVTDVLTFKEGKATGLTSLREGDKIEYLVDAATKRAIYVSVLGSTLEYKTVSGQLVSVDPVEKGIITLKDTAGKLFNYTMVNGIYGTNGPNGVFVVVDNKQRNVDTLPVGSRLSLRLVNNVVDEIKYLGEPTVIRESRGIVIENNPDMGYIELLNNEGFFVTKQYYEKELKVKKQQYYDTNDTIGYLDEVFPNFTYNPRETVITEIEPGDIVYIKHDPNNPDAIVSISAATNYALKYGKILQFTQNDKTASLLIEYENKQTSYFEVPDDIFVSKDGRPISLSDVQTGDWAKLLVNQALLEPGNVLESVKELKIEGDEHFISNIMKGQLAGINAIQKQLIVQNAQTLAKTGWGNYKNIQNVSIAGKDIEFYMDGKRISQDYAINNLKRANGEVYIALENNFTGEKVRKVTFRTGRDELLSPDTVLNSDGNGNFSILSNNGTIATDAGTIVRRNGRLVTGGDITWSDYATVSLNGGNKAAVVDITTAPDTSRVMVARGRVNKVKDGKSFTVTSMSQLSGVNWNYSPVQREFTIDYNTIFLNADGVTNMNTFITYTANSVADKVFNVVIDGSRASYVIDAPFAQKAVRGTIYETADGQISLKDATYYDDTTGKWLPVSNKDSTSVVTIPNNVVVARENKVVAKNSLKVGDQVRVMTDKLPAEITAGLAVDGYIILVEK